MICSDWTDAQNFTTYKQVDDILVRRALPSNEGAGESAQIRRFARVFVAGIQKEWMYNKTQTKKLCILGFDDKYPSQSILC